MVLEQDGARLLVAVLGNENSGKSYTWNTLFGRTVRTGREQKSLRLTAETAVEVFLVSGSPEERHRYVEDIIGNQNPRIVLCSIQYHPHAVQTINWFINNGFSSFVHWINPGFHDSRAITDNLGFREMILAGPSMLGIRNGQADATMRVAEMRDFIYGWANARGLLQSTV